MFDFALTHHQQIALILINFLKDPHLVRYFIPFLKNAEIEDSRLFHVNQTPYRKRISIILVLAVSYLLYLCPIP